MNRRLYHIIDDYMNICIRESAHDRNHIYRVLNYAVFIAENFENIDYDILIAASLLHDIARDGKVKNHAQTGAGMAKEFLETTDFPREKTDAVYHAIFNHSSNSYGKQETLEAKILYDADKLDAVGVIGIARTFIGVGNYNNPMYCLKNGEVDIDENSDTDTFVRYYLTHIDKNYDRFYTERARKLAQEMRLRDRQFYNAFINTVNENCNMGKMIDNYFVD